jgi:sulfur carrier protein
VKIRAKILFGGKKERTMEVTKDSTYEELLESLNINPEIVIIFRNGIPVPLDERLTEDDIEIMRVVSGG